MQEELSSQKRIAQEAGDKATKLEEEVKEIRLQQEHFEDELVRKWTETKRNFETEVIRSSQLEKQYQEAILRLEDLEQKEKTFELTNVSSSRQELEGMCSVGFANETEQAGNDEICVTNITYVREDQVQGFRFEDFVRLQKENRNLKLQLAEAMGKKVAQTIKSRGNNGRGP
jgi:hypothetical protein